MPNINVKIAKLTTETKSALIRELTEAAAKVTQIPKEAFMLYIEEFEMDSIGVGGMTLAEKHSNAT